MTPQEPIQEQPAPRALIEDARVAAAKQAPHAIDSATSALGVSAESVKEVKPDLHIRGGNYVVISRDGSTTQEVFMGLNTGVLDVKQDDPKVERAPKYAHVKSAANNAMMLVRAAPRKLDESIKLLAVEAVGTKNAWYVKHEDSDDLYFVDNNGRVYEGVTLNEHDGKVYVGFDEEALAAFEASRTGLETTKGAADDAGSLGGR